MRLTAIVLAGLCAGAAEAQYRYGSTFGPTVGVWPGPYFGYFPGRYGGFWTNGNSLYGPPVPTYGTVPGSLGGADQTLDIFPDLRYRRFGPWGYGYGVGVSVPLNPPPKVAISYIAAAVLEVRLPAADAELFVNGQPVAGTGNLRVILTELPSNVGVPCQLEARWSSPTSIGSARRTAILRAGERTIIDFSNPEH